MHNRPQTNYPLNEYMQIRHGSPRIFLPIENPIQTAEEPILDLPTLPLGSREIELVPLENARYRQNGSYRLWTDEKFLFGITCTKVKGATVSTITEDLYRELFEINRNAYLYRIWNYLPGINRGRGDSERYKQFCFGRSKAFYEAYGDDEFRYMPAGTCVGIEGDELVIYYLAGRKSPDHHENLNQVPAYRYPRQYGPKPPSFARATTVRLDGKHYRFISGTAAVLGHESKGKDDFFRQLELTCDNLELICEQTLKGARTPTGTPSHGSGKVYLRHAEDYPEARAYLEKRFPDIAPDLIYLRADICRQELLVEIELLQIDG